MSICVLVKVGEGLVLATDSASSIIGAAITADGKQGPQGVMKVFFSGSKLFQISELPIGVLSWGAGSFRERTIASLVEEFENQEKIRSIKREALDIKFIADQIWSFLIDKSDSFFQTIPKEGRPKTGLIVCGYSKEEFFPEEYVMTVPTEEARRLRPNIDGNPDFGANWYGMTDAIVRFHHGRDDRIFDILRENNLGEDTVEKLKQEFFKLQYPIPFNAMPLEDAVAYAKFLITMTIARFRFVIGAELCGGPVEIATITRKKGFQAKQDSEIFRKERST